MFENFEYFGNFEDDIMILMLKIVSALNGSSVRQSVVTLGIELPLQLKKYSYIILKILVDFFWS
jgi:hypothetical protein